MEIKVLIADDEDNVRNGMARFISEHGKGIYKVYTADSGITALEILFKIHPDIMIIDIQMPYKDGLQVIKEAKASGLFPKTIILSGYDRFNYAQQALRLGVADYLLKPCRPADLLALLRELIPIDESVQGAGEKKDSKSRAIDLAIEYINEHYMEGLSLAVVAEHVNLSAAYFSSLFTQTMDCNFVDYLNRVRVDHACIYLLDPSLKAYEVANIVGFKDEKYFSRIFKKVTGFTPSQFKNEARKKE